MNERRVFWSGQAGTGGVGRSGEADRGSYVTNSATRSPRYTATPSDSNYTSGGAEASRRSPVLEATSAWDEELKAQLSSLRDSFGSTRPLHKQTPAPGREDPHTRHLHPQSLSRREEIRESFGLPREQPHTSSFVASQTRHPERLAAQASFRPSASAEHARTARSHRSSAADRSTRLIAGVASGSIEPPPALAPPPLALAGAGTASRYVPVVPPPLQPTGDMRSRSMGFRRSDGLPSPPTYIRPPIAAGLLAPPPIPSAHASVVPPPPPLPPTSRENLRLQPQKAAGASASVLQPSRGQIPSLTGGQNRSTQAKTHPNLVPGRARRQRQKRIQGRVIRVPEPVSSQISPVTGKPDTVHSTTHDLQEARAAMVAALLGPTTATRSAARPPSHIVDRGSSNTVVAGSSADRGRLSSRLGGAVPATRNASGVIVASSRASEAASNKVDLGMEAPQTWLDDATPTSTGPAKRSAGSGRRSSGKNSQEHDAAVMHGFRMRASQRARHTQRERSSRAAAAAVAAVSGLSGREVEKRALSHADDARHALSTEPAADVRRSSGAERHGSGAERHGSGAERHGSGAERHGSGAERHGSGAERHGSGAKSDSKSLVTLAPRLQELKQAVQVSLADHEMTAALRELEKREREAEAEKHPPNAHSALPHNSQSHHAGPGSGSMQPSSGSSTGTPVGTASRRRPTQNAPKPTTSTEALVQQRVAQRLEEKRARLYGDLRVVQPTATQLASHPAYIASGGGGGGSGSSVAGGDSGPPASLVDKTWMWGGDDSESSTGTDQPDDLGNTGTRNNLAPLGQENIVGAASVADSRGPAATTLLTDSNTSTRPLTDSSTSTRPLTDSSTSTRPLTDPNTSTRLLTDSNTPLPATATDGTSLGSREEDALVSMNEQTTLKTAQATQAAATEYEAAQATQAAAAEYEAAQAALTRATVEAHKSIHTVKAMLELARAIDKTEQVSTIDTQDRSQPPLQSTAARIRSVAPNLISNESISSPEQAALSGVTTGSSNADEGRRSFWAVEVGLARLSRADSAHSASSSSSWASSSDQSHFSPDQLGVIQQENPLHRTAVQSSVVQRQLQLGVVIDHTHERGNAASASPTCLSDSTQTQPAVEPPLPLTGHGDAISSAPASPVNIAPPSSVTRGTSSTPVHRRASQQHLDREARRGSSLSAGLRTSMRSRSRLSGSDISQLGSGSPTSSVSPASAVHSKGGDGTSAQMPVSPAYISVGDSSSRILASHGELAVGNSPESPTALQSFLGEYSVVHGRVSRSSSNTSTAQASMIDLPPVHAGLTTTTHLVQLQSARRGSADAANTKASVPRGSSSAFGVSSSSSSPVTARDSAGTLSTPPASAARGRSVARQSVTHLMLMGHNSDSVRRLITHTPSPTATRAPPTASTSQDTAHRTSESSSDASARLVSQTTSSGKGVSHSRLSSAVGLSTSPFGFISGSPTVRTAPSPLGVFDHRELSPSAVPQTNDSAVEHGSLRWTSSRRHQDDQSPTTPGMLPIPAFIQRLSSSYQIKTAAEAIVSDSEGRLWLQRAPLTPYSRPHTQLRRPRSKNHLQIQYFVEPYSKDDDDDEWPEEFRDAGPDGPTYPQPSDEGEWEAQSNESYEPEEHDQDESAAFEDTEPEATEPEDTEPEDTEPEDTDKAQDEEEQEAQEDQAAAVDTGADVEADEANGEAESLEPEAELTFDEFAFPDVKKAIAIGRAWIRRHLPHLKWQD